MVYYKARSFTESIKITKNIRDENNDHGRSFEVTGTRAEF